MNIGMQLSLGLGLILALVVDLRVQAWVQAGQLWQQTETVFEHPFLVTNAVGELESDILAMHRDTKDLMLTANDQEIAILAHGFDGYITKPIDAEVLKKTLHEILD